MSIGGRLGLNRFSSPTVLYQPVIDYSEIIAYLNSITDSSDTVYNGINPTVTILENMLDDING